MKKYSIHSLMVLLLFVAGCSSYEPSEQSDNAAPQKSEEPNMDQTTNLLADSLNVEGLAAFEEQARQKLLDLAEYQGIATDPALNTELRAQAQAMIVALFEQPESTVDSIAVSGNGAGQRQANGKVDFSSRFAAQLQSPITDFSLLEPFGKVGEKRYEAVFQSTKSSSGGNPVSQEITVALVQVDKQFGETTKPVWEVLIVGIR